MVRGFGKELIEQLNDISTKNTVPDLTILLDVPVEIGLKRQMDNGGANRFEMEDASFHERVRQAYLELAKSQPDRWKIVDASLPVDDVDIQVWAEVSAKLGL